MAPASSSRGHTNSPTAATSAAGCNWLSAEPVAGYPVVEYTPAEIKLSVVGYGRAEKHQVGEMVRLLLGLDADRRLAVPLDLDGQQYFIELAHKSAIAAQEVGRAADQIEPRPLRAAGGRAASLPASCSARLSRPDVR